MLHKRLQSEVYLLQKLIDRMRIDKKMKEFKNMDNDMFQFLNGAVEKMKFGIKGVKTIDENGREVHSQNIFPTGISGLFVQPDTFDDFLI